MNENMINNNIAGGSGDVQPMLDIIMPVYNTARYLDKCIQSIVDQTFRRWRLIIIDDGSTDGSPSICDSWARRDSRIKVLHKENSGQGASRNVAIGMCTSEFVGFVDSDDWLEPDMYEFLVGNIVSRGADIAVCNHFTDYKDRSVCKDSGDDIVELDHDTVHRLILHDRIQSYLWQMVFRRECLAYRMPSRMCYEDYTVLPRWFENVKKVVYTKRPLYHYRMRSSSMVHDESAETSYAFLVAEKQRYSFYRGTLFGKEATIRVMLRCIRVAKYIARKDIPRKEILSYLSRIRKDLGEIDTKYLAFLSHKDHLLYRLIMRHPSMFINYQKVEMIVMMKKRKSKKRTFE